MSYKIIDQFGNVIEDGFRQRQSAKDFCRNEFLSDLNLKVVEDEMEMAHEPK